MKTAQEKYRELQEKSKKIIEGAIQINTKIEAAREAHVKLAQVAQEKFETSDVSELITKKNVWEEENDSEVAGYEKKVEGLGAEVNEKASLIKQIQQAAA